jgi:hypothetical protein
MIRLTSCLLVAILAGSALGKDSFKVTVTVTGAAEDRTNVLVVAPITLPESETIVARRARLTDAMGMAMIPHQLAEAGVLSGREPAVKGMANWELRFVIPALKANEKRVFSLELSSEFDLAQDPAGFTTAGGPLDSVRCRDTFLNGKRVMRYVFPKFDDSTKEKRFQTYKVYHHLYDPENEVMLTNGAGGQFPHHRGLFFGFNKVSYGKKQADVWHCTGDAHQSHEEDLAESTGAVTDRHAVRIAWHGPAKEVFLNETREVAINKLPGGRLVEFDSRLQSAVNDPIRLDGDPQHAGFHFRASNEVAERTKSQTYFLRPDGKGKPGETKNWEPKTRKGPVNQPWNAMSFVVSGKRYTAVYLDHPENPKEARSSERDYGRFGTYFEYTLTKDKPLRVRYRVWIQEGEMTLAQCQALSQAFVHPVSVTVK